MQNSSRIPFVLVVLIFSATMASANTDSVWHGASNNKGGKVEYSLPPSSLEYDESVEIRIRCNGYDGLASLEFIGGGLENFSAGEELVITIDGERHTYVSDAHYWGLVGKFPAIMLQKGDRLFEAMMSGQKGFASMRYNRFSSFSLQNTRQVISSHLKLCL